MNRCLSAMRTAEVSVRLKEWSRPFARGLAAFLGMTLLVVVPYGCVLYVCSPQDVEVDVVADGDAAIAVTGERFDDGTVDYSSSVELRDKQEGGAVRRVFYGRFPGSMDFSRPAFFIRSETSKSVMIGSIRLVAGSIFCKSVAPAEIAATYRVDGIGALTLDKDGLVNLPLADGSCRLVPNGKPGWRNWSVRREGLGEYLFDVVLIASFELILLLVSLVVAFRRRHDPRGPAHVWQTASLAVIAVFFVFVVVPLQSYFVNASEYPFSAARLLVDILPCAGIALVVVFAALQLSKLVFGLGVHFVLFAVLVYEYLEVGLFSMGEPPFIGDANYYLDLTSMQLDTMALFVVVALVVLMCCKLHRYFPWMLVSYFVMAAAALLDVGIDQRVTKSADVLPRFNCPREAVPLKVHYSLNRNVIVFVLDSMTSAMAKDVVAKCPEVAKAFDGFIAFDSNIGAQHNSDLSTVNIFTGECYTGGRSRSSVHEFLSKASGKGSVLLDYMESQLFVYGMVPKTVFGHGFASVSDGYSARLNDALLSKNTFFLRQPGMLSSSVFMLSLFRMSPFAYKFSLFSWMSPFFDIAEEAYVYPFLRDAPVEDITGSFIYCHTWGVHIPSGSFSHAKLCFSELAKTLNAYKGKGIYDCSTIIVIADHGPHGTYGVDKRKLHLPPIALPMLWVKPARAHWPIKFDGNAPTTHGNLHKLLAELKNRDLSAEEITAMLSSDIRVFIMQTRVGYDRWEVGRDGAVQSIRHVAAE